MTNYFCGLLQFSLTYVTAPAHFKLSAIVLFPGFQTETASDNKNYLFTQDLLWLSQKQTGQVHQPVSPSHLALQSRK